MPRPIVIAALESLSSRLDPTKGLRDPYDRAVAIQMFTALLIAGEPYDAVQVREWAEQHGWADHAQPLAALAKRILSGAAIAAGDRQMWPDDIVYIWRQSAAGDW